MGISFIKVLFLQKIIFYKSCFDPLGSDCLNNGWSISNRVAECGGYKFIGRFGQGTQLTQTFLCPGRKLRFTFTLAKIDSWDASERFYVYQDGIILDSFTYNVLDGTYMCYNSIYPEFYIEKSYSFSLPIGKNDVTIELRDSFDESIDNESWGMRNVLLEVLDPCVIFFSECNFQGNLWKICAGNQTSLTRDIPFAIKSIIILEGITVKFKDPKYFGDNIQTFTATQFCLIDFNFPKYQKQT